jgi:3-dehydroquinate dehydratase-2
MHIAIINGPNLNLVGTREQDIYGLQPLDTYFAELAGLYPDVEMTTYQSNVEGELINFIHSSRNWASGIIFNGGGYTHTSIAIADAIAAIQVPVVEVHISNIYAREAFRTHSITASKCVGCITGFGLQSYKMALQYFIDTLES